MWKVKKIKKVVKAMNKLQKIKLIFSIIIAGFVTTISLILFIQSFSVYKDEWGTDISFNSDYVVALLVGIALLMNAIVSIKTGSEVSNCICGITISFLICFYPLGVFFKALNKAMLKNAKFDFIGNQAYLYIGILGLLILIYYIISYLEIKKNK